MMESGAHTQTITADERQVDAASVARSADAALGLLSQDVELDLSEMPDGTVLYGRDAVREHWSRQTDVWEHLEMRTEWIAENDGVLVALVRLEGRGRLSGAPVSAQAAVVTTMRDGQVTSARLTFDRRAALQAVAA